MNLRKIMKKRGISPVIASIILIAITVAVAIAVAGWVFGLFGTYVGGAAVEVNYDPAYTYIDASYASPRADADSFQVRFHNGGSSDVTIVSIDFGNLKTSYLSTEITTLTITANADTNVANDSTFIWTNPPSAGETYTIRFTLSDGTVIPVVLTAKA